MDEHFNAGVKRRAIEDGILRRFAQIDFQRQQHLYLEDEQFWDFIFSWYELAHYYEESGDNTLGAPMLELYTRCVDLFRRAAQDKRIPERRRDKATDAIFQMSYYVNQMTFQARRNGIERESSVGDIQWHERKDRSGLN